jgi:hypothetical protein
MFSKGVYVKLKKYTYKLIKKQEQTSHIRYKGGQSSQTGWAVRTPTPKSASLRNFKK